MREPARRRYASALCAGLCCMASFGHAQDGAVKPSTASPAPAIDARDSAQLARLELARTSPAPRAVHELAEVLGEAPADAVTDRALEILADVSAAGGKPARELLTLYAHHRRSAARVRAYLALGKSHDRTLIETVAQGLRDPAAEVRGASARALAELGAQQASDSLILALSRGVPEAAAAFGKVASAESVPRFNALLGKAPLPAMLSGYEALLARRDLDDTTKLGMVGTLEDLGGEPVHQFFSQLMQRRDFKASPALVRAISATLSRLRRPDPESGHTP